MDLDSAFSPDGTGCRAPIWYYYAPAEVISITQNQLCLPYSQRPLQERFLRAMNLSTQYIRPDAFYAALGTQAVEQVIDFRDQRHGTVLHWVAEALGEHVYPREERSYPEIEPEDASLKCRLREHFLDYLRTLLRRIVTAGADLHALRSDAREPPHIVQSITPMLAFMRSCASASHSSSECSRAFRIWPVALTEAGVDLVSYGQKELHILRQVPFDSEIRDVRLKGKFRYGLWDHQHCFHQIADIRIGAKPCEWNIELRSRVEVWKDIPFAIPGAWEMSDQVPQLSCRYKISRSVHARPVFCRQVLDRRIVLSEPAKDPPEGKPDYLSELEEGIRDDSNALRVTRREMYLRLCDFRRSRSVGACVPHSRRETPAAYTTKSSWQHKYEDIDDRLTESWRDGIRLNSAQLRRLWT